MNKRTKTIIKQDYSIWLTPEVVEEIKTKKGWVLLAITDEGNFKYKNYVDGKLIVAKGEDSENS